MVERNSGWQQRAATSVPGVANVSVQFQTERKNFFCVVAFFAPFEQSDSHLPYFFHIFFKKNFLCVSWIAPSVCFDHGLSCHHNHTLTADNILQTGTTCLQKGLDSFAHISPHLSPTALLRSRLDPPNIQLAAPKSPHRDKRQQSFIDHTPHTTPYHTTLHTT